MTVADPFTIPMLIEAASRGRNLLAFVGEDEFSRIIGEIGGAHLEVAQQHLADGRNQASLEKRRELFLLSFSAVETSLELQRRRLIGWRAAFRSTLWIERAIEDHRRATRTAEIGIFLARALGLGQAVESRLGDYARHHAEKAKDLVREKANTMHFHAP